MLATRLRVARMAHINRAAVQRTAAIQRHMSSGAASGPALDEVSAFLFKSDGCLRTYVLNRSKKLNALNDDMLGILRPKIEEWAQGELAGVIVGTGVGRAFCAGGDVESVVKSASHPDTLPKAIDFFHKEFELDYILAAMPKPYVAVMDGITMGGGVGLGINAPFRVATENTVLAMPETKIGYCPDVGASYFLSRVDGEIGTYMALTSQTLNGRAVFEHGFATHFIPARRIPGLLERLASIDHPSYAQIDSILEEHRAERFPGEPASSLIGVVREALDKAFKHSSVEEIIVELQSILKGSTHESVRSWAQETLDALSMRSPTSLKVALAAVRRGKNMPLLEALQMEMNIATAFCHGASPDFPTGVTAVITKKSKERPNWSPDTLEEVTDAYIAKEFFSTYSPDVGTAPKLAAPTYLAESARVVNPMEYALPAEAEIQQMVNGSHPASGSTEVTLDEVVQAFNVLKKGKTGLREKIVEVVARCCTTEKDKRGEQQWLKWRH
ncbi:hypothetical protein IEO21_03174 [Rhodonia placenta]|uniref:3-hydroxyisobutyryl-CoA hydrolase n=1 Tax=Rhodonia placenta TaxID=104341 RepID=A0A8H7P6J1_9APHY|nr:hypothetical protein IEO21_03174 [Postia placenta]